MNCELQDLPNPIDKVLTFEQDGIQFKFTVTDNILIKDGDVYYMNVYKEKAQIIGTAIKGDKRIRLESEQFDKKNFDDTLWKFQVKYMVHTAVQKLK